MTQQFDVYGKPLAGGQLFIIVAGTVSTPQDAFQDTALAIKRPYPMTARCGGQGAAIFSRQLRQRHLVKNPPAGTRNGVVQLASDSVLIIGPSGGTGSGVVVDPTTLIQTGNVVLRYGVGVLGG